MNDEFYDIVEAIADRYPHYRPDAYAFVMEALAYTQKKLKTFRHVSGEDMLEGIKNLLIDKYGPMTLAVLNHWGIRSTEDFGNIIFLMVDYNILTKTEDDSIDSFRSGYDFEEVFEEGYRKQLYKKISRMR